jgi:hypothetical protein
MKKFFNVAASAGAILLLALNPVGCSQSSGGAPFVPVTNITGIPGAATVGMPLTLTGTVEPANATNTVIAWTVKDPGRAGAAISNGNSMTTTATGMVVVTAMVVNGLASSSPYTKDVDIRVSGATTDFQISFTGPDSNDITVEGGFKLFKTGAANSSITINVENPENYDAFRWLVDGAELAGQTGDSVTLNASNYNAGAYWLTVIAEKDGVPYSRKFSFAVVN